MAAALRGPFDLIVSNPPYIASDDIAALAPEVRVLIPAARSMAGPTGSIAIGRLPRRAPALLAPDGAWSSNSGPARRNRSPLYLPPRACAVAAAPILTMCRVPSWRESYSQTGMRA